MTYLHYLLYVLGRKVGQKALMSPALWVVLPLFNVPIVGTIAVATCQYVIWKVPAKMASLVSATIKSRGRRQSVPQDVVLVVTLDPDAEDWDIVDLG